MLVVTGFCYEPVLPDSPSFQLSAKTIHNNRFFSALLQAYGHVFLAISGWRVTNQPPAIAKFVAIAAPHTSNWDFPVFMAAVGYLRTNISFLGKHSLFEGYFGWLFYWLGGIPVKRESGAASAVVDQVVQVFSESESLILGIAPEGTRSRVKKWKTGFYRIALAARVPIVPGYVDSKTKTIGFGEAFTPTGDMEADLIVLQNFYKDKTGINPQNH
ncbi:MAG: acyltransferase [Gammaproteobacteria bacterium]|nr:acyltransferase [Gammaproteobacteria bacterium]